MGGLMKINIKNININYIQYGSGDDIVLLHGWGQNIEMMKPIGDRLEKNFRITILDLPGFGKSEAPKNEWMLNDYVSLLHNLFSELNIEKHQQYLKDISLNCSFKSEVLPSRKISFLMTEFRDKLLEYINLNDVFDKNIKNIVAELDVDYLYDTFSKFSKIPFTNYLCLEPDVFSKANFLHIMHQVGLLNFDF